MTDRRRRSSGSSGGGRPGLEDRVADRLVGMLEGFAQTLDQRMARLERDAARGEQERTVILHELAEMRVQNGELRAAIKIARENPEKAEAVVAQLALPPPKQPAINVKRAGMAGAILIAVVACAEKAPAFARFATNLAHGVATIWRGLLAQ